MGPRPPADGAYYRFGLKYREILKRHGIELELLRDPESGVDVALMQGVVGSEDPPGKLYGLATLLFPLFKIAPPTYRWRIRSRIYTHYKYLFDVEAALTQEPSLERMDNCLVTMGKIEDELGEINVPLSYADQMYQLRMHVRFVKQRVNQAREKLLNPD